MSEPPRPGSGKFSSVPGGASVPGRAASGRFPAVKPESPGVPNPVVPGRASSGRLPVVGAGAASRASSGRLPAIAAAPITDDDIRNLLATPQGKVFGFTHFWICPLCEQIGGRIHNAQEWAARAADHLRRDCPAARAGRKAPKVPIEHLREIALIQGVRFKISADPVWQLHDRAGAWYCPFCVASGVKLGRPERVQLQDAEAIVRHIRTCFYYDAGKGKPKDLEDLRERVKEADTTLGVAEDFAPRLAKDPIWRVRDRNGCWVCPYCRRGIVTVDFVLDRPEAAVEGVAAHLLKACESYLQKKPPAPTVEDLMRSEIQPRGAARTFHESRETVVIEKNVYETLKNLAKEGLRARTESHHDIEMEKNMASAQKKQMQMLPKAPLLPGFEVEVLFKPSHQLSGDFYDFIPFSDDRLGLLIGDVSGHGVDAAMVMGMAKKVLSIAGRSQESPRDVLASANELILPDLDKQTFVTACYGALNTKSRVFRFARAGHNPVLIYNPGKADPPFALRPSGIALGMATGAKMENTLEDMEVTLNPGDYLLLYTDGVTESADPAGEELGIEGFMGILPGLATKDAHSLLAGIDAYLVKFRGDKPQEDDITIVCVKVL